MLRNLTALVILIFSSAAGAQDRSASTADFNITGAEENALLGFSIDAGRDVNGDGFDDFVVGAPKHSAVCDLTTGESCDGYALVLQGQNADALWSVFGDTNSSFSSNAFGYSVSFGDFNGDGFSDLAVGAPQQDLYGTNSGQVYLFYGPDGEAGPKLGCDRRSGALCGKSVSASCDFNQDGFDDILVGSENRIHLYSGRDQSLIFLFFSQQGSNDEWAKQMSGAGDLNNDGFPDILVSAPGSDEGGIDRGRVYAYSGADGTQIWEGGGAAAADLYGSSISRLGDVNGDGFDDFMIGAVQLSGPGFVDLISGRDGLPIVRLNGSDYCKTDNPDCDFGASVTTAGDLNDDGRPDFLVSDPKYDSSRGRVYAFSGLDFSLLFQITGEGASGDAFSAPCTGVTGAFDANQDGFTDYLCGAAYHDAGGQDAGRAYLFFGGSGDSSNDTPNEDEPNSSHDAEILGLLERIELLEKEKLNLESEKALWQTRLQSCDEENATKEDQIFSLEMSIEELQRLNELQAAQVQELERLVQELEAKKTPRSKISWPGWLKSKVKKITHFFFR